MIPPGLCTRVVAAGLAEAGRSRAAVIVLPCRGGDIRHFPSVAHGLLDGLTSVKTRHPDGTAGPDLPVVGKAAFPPDRLDRLLGLWQSLMAGSEAEWDQLLEVFDSTGTSHPGGAGAGCAAADGRSRHSDPAGTRARGAGRAGAAGQPTARPRPDPAAGLGPVLAGAGRG